MKHAWCLGLWVALLALPGTLTAEQPYREFLDGLKQRQYYDYVLLYLDELEQDPDVPADLREVFGYERAVAHLELARLPGKAQAKHLDEAEAALEQFVREHPDHPLAGDALTTRANLALNRARVEIRKLDSGENASTADQSRKRARELIAQARSIFQSAHDRHQAAWEKFPPHVDERDKELRAKRDRVETNFLRAQLDLALCTYEEARTYDNEPAKHQELMTRAADEFEAIHQKYRSQGVGLFARMWQGKCFEEQDDLRKALGIYDELLGHPGTSKTMQMLQDQVLWFRLICLNHPERRDQDSELVINEAGEWLKLDKSRTRSEVGFGIRWERCRAHEYLSDRRELSPQERTKHLRLALDDAQQISRFPNPLRDVAVSMVQNLNGELNDGSSDPRDFDTAFSVARKEVSQIKDIQSRIENAGNAEEKESLETDFKLHLQETARLLRLALDLGDDADVQQLNTVRYYLAYVYYLERRSYEAAVLAEFIARHYQDEDSQMALDAAHLAMAAYQQSYNDSPEERRRPDLEFMVGVCRLITNSWPQSERAVEARLNLGRMLNQLNQPAESARWYAEVPESASQYAAAQIAAGQALWTACLQAGLAPEEQRPDAETLQSWQTDAEKYLATGIRKFEERLQQDEAARDDLTAAKVSLSQIMVSDGRYEEATRMLTGQPHSVIDAIAVEAGQQRPERGVTSGEFAALAYQLLLRSYVGTQKIDEALEAMQLLEGVASTSSDQSVTAVYVQLGKGLQDELTRLKQLGQTERLAQVRDSFDRFLAEMFERREGQSYGVLIWIAETYYGLAQATQEDDAVSAAAYFDKAAATYRAIMDRAAVDPTFVNAPRLQAITLRLVNCLREQGNFSEALDALGPLLKDKPKALDVQFAAANVLQAWGAREPKRYLDAINGFDDATAPVWGWGQISLRLQRAQASGTSNAEYESKYFEARYNVSWCRRQYAMTTKDTSVRTSELEAALQEIGALAAVTGSFPDQWWEKFDTLYRDLQRDLGRRPVVALERPVSVQEIATAGLEAGEASVDDEATAAQQSARRPPQSTSVGTMILGGLVVALLLAGCVAAYFLTTSDSKRRRAMYAEFLEPAAPPTPPGVKSRSRRAASKKSPSPTPRPKGS